MQSHLIPTLSRRHLLRGTAALGGLAGLGALGGGLGGCAVFSRTARPSLVPIHASAERIFDITVCTRPFRAQGPRLEVEQIGNTKVVHNYGHGGSGWSLSWGSGTLAVRRAMESSPRAIAVIGCGALGLTSAILAQQAGAQVTIYAKDLIYETRSSRATGLWSPDSRIALTSAAAPDFAARWEEMARISFKTYRRYLGLPGTPVEWMDNYYVYDDPPAGSPAPAPAPAPTQEGAQPELDFAAYNHLIADLTPRYEEMPKERSPFPTDHTRRGEILVFNIADYAHTLMTDFLLAGGKIVRREFHTPNELTTLKEKVVINCPGYAARAWWKDESIVPVRGQIAWLIPQPEAHYAIYYRRVSVVSRRDGIVVQALSGGDMRGYGDASETVDRAEAESSVATVAELFSRMRAREISALPVRASRNS